MRAHVAERERIAVGVCARRPRDAGGAARTDDVLDDDLLAEQLRELFRHDAARDVGRPARRERHDQGHGARRIGLRIGARNPGKDRNSGDEKQLSHVSPFGSAEMSVLVMRRLCAIRAERMAMLGRHREAHRLAARDRVIDRTFRLHLQAA